MGYDFDGVCDLACASLCGRGRTGTAPVPEKESTTAHRSNFARAGTSAMVHVAEGTIVATLAMLIVDRGRAPRESAHLVAAGKAGELVTMVPYEVTVVPFDRIRNAHLAPLVAGGIAIGTSIPIPK